jgi:hypothetical protein
MGVAAVPDVAVGAAISAEPVAAMQEPQYAVGLSATGGAVAVVGDDVALNSGPIPAAAPAAAGGGDSFRMEEGVAEDASICNICTMDSLRATIAASQQEDDIAASPGTGRLNAAGQLDPVPASSLPEPDPIAAAPGASRDKVTVADYTRPTINTTWSTTLNKGWAGIGIASSLVTPTNPSLATTGTQVLQMCNGQLQVWNVDPETGLNDTTATPAIRFQNFLASATTNEGEALSPPGNASTYFYVDTAATFVKGSGVVFAFTSAPRGGSDLSAQTFNWWLASMDINTATSGMEQSWSVFRFDPALPAASGASCTAPAKPQITKIQLTYDFGGVYVSGIVNCIQDVGGVRNVTSRGPVIYAMDANALFGAESLTQVAVFTTADLVASLPTGTGVTAASFNQMQPALPQSDEDVFIEGVTEEEPYVVFVGQVSGE